MYIEFRKDMTYYNYLILSIEETNLYIYFCLNIIPTKKREKLPFQPLILSLHIYPKTIKYTKKAITIYVDSYKRLDFHATCYLNK